MSIRPFHTGCYATTLQLRVTPVLLLDIGDDAPQLLSPCAQYFYENRHVVPPIHWTRRYAEWMPLQE